MAEEDIPQPSFIIVWEFQVRPEKRPEFEEAYGPEGIWAAFFRGGEGYIRTELRTDAKLPGRYLTLDFWESRSAFEHIKQKRATDYQAIDEKCESLTAEEKFLGHCEGLEQLSTLLAGHHFAAGRVQGETRIREMRPHDIAPVISLEESVVSAAHWSENAYRDVFASDSARAALVAEDEAGTIVGFVIARTGAEESELENMVVRKDQQRRGIGKRLLMAIIDSARARSKQIFLEVRETNASARAFYEACGFTSLGRRSAYYRDPAEDAVIYRLQL